MLAGEALGHVDQRGLDRAVAVGAVGLRGGDRGDYDEGRVARRLCGFLEERVGGVEGVDRGEHVELEVLFPGVDVIALGHRAGIRDEDVEAAEFVRGRSDPVLEGGAVGDVHARAGGFDAESFQFGHGGGNLVCIARADPEIRAFFRERVRDRTANAARAAEDERVLAFDVEIHGGVSCFGQPHRAAC